MGNTSSFDSTFYSASLFGIIVSGLSLMIVVFLTFFFNYMYSSDDNTKPPIYELFYDKKYGRHKQAIVNVGTVMFLLVLYLVIFVNPSITWTLRNGAPMVECNQATADDGSCGGVSRAAIYILVFGIQGIAWGKFMKWRSAVQIVYTGFSAGMFLFLTLFTLFYNDAAKWTAYTFGIAFAAGCGILHILSLFSSWVQRFGKQHIEVPDMTKSYSQKPVFGEMRIHGDNWINKVYYGPSRPEFYINLFFGIFAKILYAFIYLFGPEGIGKYGASEEAWAFTALDTFFVVILAYLFAVFYAFKTPIELDSIGQKIALIKAARLPQQQQKPLLGNSLPSLKSGF